MSLELNTEYEGATIEQYLQKINSLGERIHQIEEFVDFELPVVVPQDAYEPYFETEETEHGFSVQVMIRGLKNVTPIRSFQLKANFPPGVDFLGAAPGGLFESWGFGYQAANGHPKEGLVGAYSGFDLEYDGEDDAVLCSLAFAGPQAARFAVTLTQFNLSYLTYTRDGVFPLGISE